jgi:hypothetical protein
MRSLRRACYFLAVNKSGHFGMMKSYGAGIKMYASQKTSGLPPDDGLWSAGE